MKHIRLALLIALIVVSFAVYTRPTTAQATQPASGSSKCDPASLIAQFAALKSTGDNTKDLQALDGLSAQISDQRIACNGLTFTGMGSKVLDPFTLPSGAYRVKMVGSGDSQKDGIIAAFIKPITSDGDCSVLIPQDGETSLVTSSDCRAVVDVTSGPTVPWTITFEVLK